MLAMYGSELVKPFKSGERFLLGSRNVNHRYAQGRGERISGESSMDWPMPISYFHVSSVFRFTSTFTSMDPQSKDQNSFRCNCVLRWSLDDAQYCRLWFDGNRHHEGVSKLLFSHPTPKIRDSSCSCSCCSSVTEKDTCYGVSPRYGVSSCYMVLARVMVLDRVMVLIACDEWGRGSHGLSA